MSAAEDRQADASAPIAVDALAELAWSIFAPQGGPLEKQGRTTRGVWREIARQVIEADRTARPASTPASFLLLDGHTPGEVAWKAFYLNTDEFYLTAVGETHRVAWERSAQAVIEAALLAGMQGRLDVQAVEESTDQPAAPTFNVTAGEEIPCSVGTDGKITLLDPANVVAELQARLAALEAENARLAAELDAARTSPPRRRTLPSERPSLTHKFVIGDMKGFLTVGLYPDTGRPGELFCVMDKQGSLIHGLLDAWCRACSVALQYGMPVEDLVQKFSHFRFEPAGFTRTPELPHAHSLVDYIVRWIALRFCAPPAQSLPIGLGGALVESPAAPSTTTQPQPVEA